MAFTHFTNGTLANADEVNNNFYYIAQGDRLPIATATMGYTDGAFNIGATATTWANLYADNIYCTNLNITGSVSSSSVRNILMSLSESAGTSFEFTGLQGDTEKEYYLYCGFKCAASGATLSINFNGISGTSYYHQYNGGIQSGVSSCTLIVNSGSQTASIFCNIYANSGNNRLILANMSSPTPWGIYMYNAFMLANTSDEITSLKITTSNTITNINIQLWQS